MPDVRILTERELRAEIGLDVALVNAIEDAFLALATKPVVMPPILRLDIPEHRGEMDVKTAYVPGLSGFALKVSPGFFDNPKLGLPSVNGLMMLLSSTTGLVEALFLDNGYLTDLRTAAAGAVAARHLARADAKSAAILGAGVQAGLQLEALMLVRPIERAVLWARDTEKATAKARALSEKLEIPVEAVSSAREAVESADVIVTTTPSTAPLIEAGWLRSGQHVTAMGSDAEHKNEIDPQAIAGADLYVADSLSQTRRLGELHHAIEAGLVSNDASFPELGAVIAGSASGRPSDTAFTIVDLTGTGVQDTAIATLAHARIVRSGAGTTIHN
ncbi:ornithine cyclodeaminase protein [Fulvimarina pelagi HTCC2506]|uniref:Ornithine cyclodeaminase protein n=1 Tax=Fulvimarina pelagi HTCC2506 TaxID=314231 RepID=Q0G402_9HYPH|nr:cyclodeaminase [Fulvimarina pelagi]EAU41679.1 ornithine cyclodeaminase protein [Fulvimarina pelagi HTCC2506]